MIVSTILISFFIGIILALLALKSIKQYSLIPVALTVPFQLYLAGCFEVWTNNK